MSAMNRLKMVRMAAGAAALLLLASTAFPAVRARNTDREREQSFNREQKCRDAFWQCRARSAKAQGKMKERNEIICTNRFHECMARWRELSR
jgi:hypothetical protein